MSERQQDVTQPVPAPASGPASRPVPGSAGGGVRAVGTLVGGASWTAPGTGWRSVWQLVMVAFAVGGLVFPARRTLCVAAIGAVYAAATLLELAVDGDRLIGLIPVDMRDRVIHPLVAALAVASVVAVLGRPRPVRSR
ncbi:hypothetical protein [Candidatus Frankia nodulisporulans]|uniref:hypothetical protein n=1 Tax=Candidatus Frankia nodulisporulans TaxID=2060052 RepID=UPI0013CF94CF|nr:hypothetical protein [Candidatus Frankia nodulisporulans]